MASTVQELRDWLEPYSTDTLIGIDDGGLTLRVDAQPGEYFELGGLPVRLPGRRVRDMPLVGARASCRKCGHEIEWSGTDWRDRGNGTRCLPPGGFDRDGKRNPTPRGKHRP